LALPTPPDQDLIDHRLRIPGTRESSQLFGFRNETATLLHTAFKRAARWDVPIRFVLCVGAFLLVTPLAYAAAPERHPAQVIVDRADLAVRIDPEASRRGAEQALELLKRKPDVDLEIRARLILCDYQSERDTAAAEQQITQIEALLPTARRTGCARAC